MTSIHLVVKQWRDWFLYLLYTEQGHRCPRHRLRHRGHRFDEDHAPLLQSQRAGQGVGTLWSREGGESVPRAGDQAQVLQGEVQDGRTGAVEPVALLDGVWRGGRRGGFVKTKADGRDLLGEGRSGACAWQNKQNS